MTDAEPASAAADVPAARERYADEIAHVAHLTDPRVIRAFARVPRERYLGPGPWRIFQTHTRRYWTTPDAEPRHLYHDVLVAIDEGRMLNNGQPSFLAWLIEALEIREGEHVVHVGCGTGYFTAILAELAGPAGRVTAIEVDPALAARSRENLADSANVRVVEADGGAHDPGSAAAILVNAGATHPRRTWLDSLAPHGRLLLPLTGPKGAGGVLKVARLDRGYSAGFVASISIFACVGARDARAEERLVAAFARGGPETVRSLRRDPHEPAASCWLHGEDHCLSALDPA